MDPLSVAASVTGLIMAGAQITSLVQRLLDAPAMAHSVETEISHFVVVLSQLQPFLSGATHSLAHHSRTSLIEVQQIQIILTGSVFTLSELQAAVGAICQGSTISIGLRDRMKWMMAESNLAQLVQRVRDHKSSLTLILTLLTCQTTSEAMSNMTQLRVLLEHFIQHNTQLFTRVQELENQSHAPPPFASSADPSIRSAGSNRLPFEQVLLQSDLYKRSLNTRDPSAHSRPGPSGNWSIALRLSLSQVPDICAMPLGVSPAELSNPQCYATATLTQPQVFATTQQRRSSAARVRTTNSHYYRSLEEWDSSVWELVKSGADKEAVYPGSYPPIQMIANYIHVMGLNEACKKGAHHTVSICLQRGADIGYPNAAGDFPVHVAARNGHHQSVEVLLQWGAHVEARNPFLETPLHLAAMNGHHEAVRVLLGFGAHTEARNNWGDTPLYLAAGHGQRDAVSVLVQAGAAIQDERDFDDLPLNITGSNALHIAAGNGHRTTMAALLRSGAKKEWKNRFGMTAFHFAAKNGQDEVVVELVKFGAQMEAGNKFGLRPLHLAASNGNCKTIKALLESGADIEAKTDSGDSPLHHAVGNGSCETIRVFLESGADIEAENHAGNRPLHLAVDGGKKEIVSLLLESGVDMNVLDGCGRSTW